MRWLTELHAKFRAGVRRWLGVANLPSVDMYRAHEASARERQKALLAASSKVSENLTELCTKLDRIETMLITSHAFEKPRPAPIFGDWEQVSLEALHQMLLHPEQEPK